MMCEDNGTRTYIIDGDYRLIQFSENLKDYIPDAQAGDFCYEKLCGKKQPCESCPITGNEIRQKIFYNPKLRKWLDVTSSRIVWPENGQTYYWMTARDLEEENLNLLAQMTEVFSYDELAELNLTRGTYHILSQGGRVPPQLSGSLEELILYNAEHFIHPEERERFLGFWDVVSIRDCFLAGTDRRVCRERFRMRPGLTRYDSVDQILIPVRRKEHSDVIAMCFLKYKKTYAGNAREGYVRDTLTSLLGREGFLYQCGRLLMSQNTAEWYLAALDIEHFKLFNEWFGQPKGDRLLSGIGSLLNDYCQREPGIAGYFGGDDFFLLLHADDDKIRLLLEDVSHLVLQYSEAAGFLPLIGVYRIVDTSLPLSGMCDKAQIAITSIKGNFNQRICYYEEGMMERLETRKRLLSDVQKGIDRREFTFYAQPKCSLSTGRIVGLEALVRWHHPQYGLIPPSEYIPLLEETGLITNLDMYIWEEVCKALYNWLRGGHSAVTISVNVSLVDLQAIDVPAVFRNLIRKYDLPAQHLGIEITESAYAEDLQTVNAAVEELQAMGISILMDDFGSGYSSLNMLKNIKVDILKMDMKFLDIDEHTYDRGLNIIESIFRLANLMDLRVVAEGVETKAQAEFLQKMGCVYGQGYYFYHPMPVEELDVLLEKAEVLDLRGMRKRQIGQIYAQDLFSAGLLNDRMLNNILGAFAFYEEHMGKIKLLKVNEQYCDLVGANLANMEDQSREILDWIHPEDRERLLDGMEKSAQDPSNGIRMVLRRKRLDGSYIWLGVKVFFLWEKAEGRRIYYASAYDVTDSKKRESSLQAIRETLDTMWQIADKKEHLRNLTEENRQMAISVFTKMSPSGMIGGYCEEGFPLYFANDEIVRLLGYDSYDDFAAGIRGSVENTIHPEDYSFVSETIGSDYYVGKEYSVTYRMIRKDGSWFWVIDKGRVVEAEDGRLAIVSACSDITDIIENQRLLAAKNSTLTQENEELNYYVSRMPGAYHRCVNNESYDFLYISHRFEEMSGFSREEIREKFQNSFWNMVHPEDRERLRTQTDRIVQHQNQPDMEYRMLTSHGYIWVLDQSQYLTYQGIDCIQGIVLDVTEARRQKETLTWLAQTDSLTGLLNRTAAIRKIRAWLEDRLTGGERPRTTDNVHRTLSVDSGTVITSETTWTAEHGLPVHSSETDTSVTAAFIMLDMDNFKQLNDKIGHPGGDRALQQCARKIRQLFPENAICCRMGGDEFAIFCPGLSSAEVESRLNHLTVCLAEPYTENTQEICLAISAGYAVVPEDGTVFEELYHKADLALLKVKRAGKGNVLHYRRE